MFGKTNVRTNTRRIQTLPETIVNDIQCSILRRPNYNSEGPRNNHNNAPTQRTRGHQQDDGSGETILMATDNMRYTTKMR